MSQNVIHALLYISTASRLYEKGELHEILTKSRDNNARDGITGVLVYRSGNFVQFIEGPPLAIDDLLGRLKADPRHYDVTVIRRFEANDRAFPEWAMGFADLRMQNVPDVDRWIDQYVQRAHCNGPDAEFACEYLRDFTHRNR